MKNVIYTMLAVIMLTFPHFSFGEDYQHISPEVSAILISNEYAQMIKEQKNILKRDGHEVRISMTSTLEIPPDNKYVYISLDKKMISESSAPWKPYGDIVSKIIYTRNNGIIIEAMYFAGATEPPGGSSVGNN